MLPNPKPTGVTNELAKERNRAATERTLTSWIQSCLSLIGFGIAFDRILTALNQLFPANSTVINLRWTHTVGLSVIAFGVLLLVLAIWGYLREIRLLAREDYLYRPISSFNLAIVVGAVIIFGLISLAAVFVVISWGEK